MATFLIDIQVLVALDYLHLNFSGHHFQTMSDSLVNNLRN